MLHFYNIRFCVPCYCLCFVYLTPIHNKKSVCKIIEEMWKFAHTALSINKVKDIKHLPIQYFRETDLVLLAFFFLNKLLHILRVP